MSPYNRTEPHIDFQEEDHPKERVGIIIFGAGSKRFRSQALALREEARQTGWFDTMLCITDEDDEIFDKLLKPHVKLIQDYRKGFGLWFWKPILIQHALSTRSDIDVWVYADSGCEISLFGTNRFYNYLKLSVSTGALFFSIPFRERSWTKHSLFKSLNVSEEDSNTCQVQATFFIVRNQENVLNLIDSWTSLVTEHNYENLLEPPKGENSKEGFIEHRHDQSLLSILVKKSEFSVLEWEDRFHRSFYVPNSWVLLYPIHARRAKYFRVTPFLCHISSFDLCKLNHNNPSSVFKLSVLIVRCTSNLYAKFRDVFNALKIKNTFPFSGRKND